MTNMKKKNKKYIMNYVNIKDVNRCKYKCKNKKCKIKI